MARKRNKPLPVTVDGNNIKAYLYFHKSLEGTPEGYDETYADMCVNGITRYWSEAGFNVEIIRLKESLKVPHVKVLPAKLTRTSYVMSPAWRWIWGFFKNFHPEAMMLNWSPSNPGNIHLNLRFFKDKNRFERVSAHEFGHVLGLGDAYGAHYRFFYEAPGTEDYMMNHNRKVSPEEALMVKRAHETGKMQYFPMKFSARKYASGLRKKRKT